MPGTPQGCGSGERPRGKTPSESRVVSPCQGRPPAAAVRQPLPGGQAGGRSQTSVSARFEAFVYFRILPAKKIAANIRASTVGRTAEKSTHLWKLDLEAGYYRGSDERSPRRNLGSRTRRNAGFFRQRQVRERFRAPGGILREAPVISVPGAIRIEPDSRCSTGSSSTVADGSDMAEKKDF